MGKEVKRRYQQGYTKQELKEGTRRGIYGEEERQEQE